MRSTPLLLLLLLLPLALLAEACSAAAPTPATTGPSVTPAAVAPATASSMPAASAVPTTPRSTTTLPPDATAGPAPALVVGWPRVRSAGVTMRGGTDYDDAFEGCPAPGPAIEMIVRLKGLAPGETVRLAGVGEYDFWLLGCGVQPSPCTLGSDTTDPDVHLCRPLHREPAKGTVKEAVRITADADGRASATIRFAMPEAARDCPAGAGLPWYAMTGNWRVRVTDRAHGLRLVSRHNEVGP